jgi:heme/copper-type cytochrome/quinol oxidase subunit 2
MSLVVFLLPLAEDAAKEGKKVITAMLIVGLIFVAVIAIGETTHWLRARRKARRRATPY